MKIEITKERPPMIAWLDGDKWVKREKATYKNLRKHGFNHCLLLSMLLILLNILKGKD